MLREIAEQNAALDFEGEEDALLDLNDWLMNNVNEYEKVTPEMATLYADEFIDNLQAIKEGRLDDVRYMTKRSNTDTNKALAQKFAADYAKWDKKKTGGYFVIAKTSDVMKGIGIEDKTINWDQSKIKEVLKKHPEMKDAIVEVPKLLENPVIIMSSRTVLNRVIFIGEVNDKKNDTVIAALELRPTGKNNIVIKDIMKMTSAHGRDTKAIQVLLDGSEIHYINPDKKITDTWLVSRRLQLPVGISQYGYISKVTYYDIDVKTGGKIVAGGETKDTRMADAIKAAMQKKELAPTDNEDDAKNKVKISVSTARKRLSNALLIIANDEEEKSSLINYKNAISKIETTEKMIRQVKHEIAIINYIKNN